MSAAEDAYIAAEGAIAEAKRTGAEGLTFHGEVFRALESLPPEIAKLNTLFSLDVGRTQVSDLVPLQGLTGLRSLSLNESRVNDLSPLKALTRLTDITLGGTLVTELAPLAGLTELRSISFDNTQIGDVSPLQGLKKLWGLFASATQVSDLAPLKGLTGLQRLALNNTHVSDLAPLQGLKELHDLMVEYTQVSDLAPLRELTGLQSLWLNNTQVNDLAPLRELTGLQTLSLDSTQVSDLAPLRELTGLRTLSIDSTQVSDLAPLRELTGLQTLPLGNTQVSDLNPLRELTGLQYLSLDNTQVSDLDPLRELLGLRRLWLNRTPVSNLAPIRELTNLQFLSLSYSQVPDLRPISGLRKLGDEPEGGGLTFHGIPATADPKIAEIAEIADPKARVKALFALLDAGWVPPVASAPRKGEVDDPPPEPAPPHPFFFLSYASQDRPQIGTLRDFLMGHGLPVWWDQDIPAGAEWRRTIATQLDAAKAVVTFWTQESVTRKAVIEEASHAQAAGKLLQVRLDDAPLPYGFGETQYVDLRGWDGTATHPQMAKLLQALRDRLNPPDAAAMAARLLAASPVAMLPKDGRLAPVDTPPNVRPEVENAPDLAARVEGLKQILGPLRAMAADRDHYQFPADLGHTLATVHSALHAETLSWYGIDDARATLRDCMSAHNADHSWNTTMVYQLERLTQRLAELCPLLQPRQVPAGEPGAKPPEPDPMVRAADVAAVQEIAVDVSGVLESPEALATLDPASIDLLRAEVDRIKHAAGAGDEGRRYSGLRKGVRGLAYGTGAIIGAVTSAVTVSLLTVPQAAAALAARLKPVFDRLLRYFM